MKSSEYKLHVINSETNKMVWQGITNFVPAVGDEFRMYGEKYFKVALVVWVMDEPECPLQRVNIGVVDTKLGE